jgi:hypothetical protein
MGAAVSVSKVTNAINTSTDLSQQASMSACDASTTSAANNLHMSGSCKFNGVTVNQKSMANSACTGKAISEMSQDLVNNLTTNLNAATTSSMSGIPMLQFNASTSLADSIKNISTKVTSADVQNCAVSTNALATNTLVCDGDASSTDTVVNQTAVASQLQYCILQNEQVSSALNSVYDQVSAQATASQSGIFGGVTGIIILGIIIVGAVGAFKTVNSKGGQQALQMAAKSQGLKVPTVGATTPKLDAKPTTGAGNFERAYGGCGGEASWAPTTGGGCGCSSPPPPTSSSFASASGGDDDASSPPSALRSFLSPTKFLIGGVLISIMFIIFYKQNWWPYKAILATDDADTQAATKSRNKKILMVAIFAGIACLLGAIVFNVGKFVKNNPQVLLL